MTKTKIHRALISASNKHGLEEFAQQLSELHCELIATGKTAQLLMQHKIPVIEVSQYTEFPEIFGGRVKTLHPKILGGVLARRDVDATQMQTHHIPSIDLIVANLYPFQETVAQADCSLEHAIEQIDIGGVTLIRAAAKNYRFTTVLVDPADYATVIHEIKEFGAITEQTRFDLAKKAFAYTSQYEAAIAKYFSTPQSRSSETKSETQSFPQQLQITFTKQTDLRYGENPHQHAASYANPHANIGIAQASLLQGKPLSFNNLLDADTAFRCVRNFNTNSAACVIIKHATPCGVAIGNTLLAAYDKAFACDAQSAFGGIIAFNQPLDAKTAQHILSQQFVEVIIAPKIDSATLNVFATKPNIRLLQCDIHTKPNDCWTYHSITGGLLLQSVDDPHENSKNWKIVTQRKPNDQEMNDLNFAWQVAKSVKSNAIVYAKNGATLGIGSGQTSRVFSAKIAALKAQEAHLSLENAVMASDGFFPFEDGIEVAAQAGIKNIIQPGGSIRDPEIIAKADELGLAMVLTGIRHFRH